MFAVQFVWESINSRRRITTVSYGFHRLDGAQEFAKSCSEIRSEAGVIFALGDNLKTAIGAVEIALQPDDFDFEIIDYLTASEWIAAEVFLAIDRYIFCPNNPRLRNLTHLIDVADPIIDINHPLSSANSGNTTN